MIDKKNGIEMWRIVKFSISDVSLCPAVGMHFTPPTRFSEREPGSLIFFSDAGVTGTEDAGLLFMGLVGGAGTFGNFEGMGSLWPLSSCRALTGEGASSFCPAGFSDFSSFGGGVSAFEAAFPLVAPVI